MKEFRFKVRDMFEQQNTGTLDDHSEKPLAFSPASSVHLG